MTAPEDRPLIYVAGPYSKPDPVANTRLACQVGDVVWGAGGCPVIPHLTMLWDLISPAPHETWLERDLGLLARCDGLVRIAGRSDGADREVVFATDRGIKVTYWYASDGGASDVAVGTLVEYLKRVRS